MKLFGYVNVVYYECKALKIPDWTLRMPKIEKFDPGLKVLGGITLKSITVTWQFNITCSTIFHEIQL